MNTSLRNQLKVCKQELLSRLDEIVNFYQEKLKEGDLDYSAKLE
jgi:hypothetical protein